MQLELNSSCSLLCCWICHTSFLHRHSVPWDKLLYLGGKGYQHHLGPSCRSSWPQLPGRTQCLLLHACHAARQCHHRRPRCCCPSNDLAPASLASRLWQAARFLPSHRAVLCQSAPQPQIVAAPWRAPLLPLAAPSQPATAPWARHPPPIHHSQAPRWRRAPAAAR